MYGNTRGSNIVDLSLVYNNLSQSKNSSHALTQPKTFDKDLVHLAPKMISSSTSTTTDNLIFYLDNNRQSSHFMSPS
ncbi:hypothetical protein BgiMline_017470 [Biomphalaria glabrata]